jgi:hypothetical protein
MASPLPSVDLADAVDSIAHIIQVALTPVFLLSGIGTLLNVFNTRLAGSPIIRSTCPRC